MERLQAAIERARSQREGMTPAKGKTSDSARPTPPAAWDSLAMINYNAGRLLRHRVFAEGHNRESTHFDILRTKVLQQCRENGWKRILVTSPTKGCGKTTTCANLAASFARQDDRRLVLLDLDMRRPELARLFEHRAEFGFSAVLSGEVAFADQAVRISGNVAISMNQAPAANPSKLLLQDRTPEILAEIEETYKPDVMLFDSPPLLVTDDTLALLKQVDAVLIVAAAESTTVDQVDACEKEIAEQTNVMGVILNKYLYSGETYGYNYKY